MEVAVVSAPVVVAADAVVVAVPACCVCFDESPLLTYPCGHSSKMCNACFIDSAVVGTRNGNSNFQCNTCNAALPVEFVSQQLLASNSQVLDTFCNLVFNKWFQSQPGAKFCPSSGCGAPIIGCLSAQFWDCPACKSSFCHLCDVRQANHGSECGELRKRRSMTAAEKKAMQDDLMFKQWMVTESEGGDPIVVCPSCHAGVTKNEGCNHMRCICSYEFCYFCAAPYYDSNGEQHDVYHGGISYQEYRRQMGMSNAMMNNNNNNANRRAKQGWKSFSTARKMFTVGFSVPVVLPVMAVGYGIYKIAKKVKHGVF